MSFDLQIIVMLVVVAIAMYRVRPGTLLFAINQTVTLRAFQNFSALGQPRGFWFLPNDLFGGSTLAGAHDVMLVVTGLLLASVLMPEHETTHKRDPLPAIPPAMLWAIAVYFVILFFSTRTVLEVTYAADNQRRYGAETGLTGGLYPLTWSIVLVELRRRVDAKLMSPRRALALVVVGVFFLDYLKGATGLATGVVIATMFLVYLPGETARLADVARADDAATPGGLAAAQRKALTATLMTLVVVGVCAATIRGIRPSVARVGVAVAIAEYAASVVEQERTSADTGEGVEALGNGTQSAAHVLMCVALYDTGHSREWRSVWGPIEYTFKPSLVMSTFGLQRSREAAWELADYYIHVGGINTFGELYWNGGFLCLMLVGGALIYLIYLVDVRSKTSLWWLLMGLSCTTSLFQAYGYGFAQVFRGFANGAMYLIPIIGYLHYYERQRAASAAIASTRDAMLPGRHPTNRAPTT